MLNLSCPINQLSYGLTGLNALKAITKLGEAVSLFPIGKVTVTNDKDEAIVKQCLTNAQTYDSKSPSIRLYHQFSLAEHVGVPRIGYPIFELDNFNELEKHHIQSQDYLFVPSEWGARVVRETCGVESTVVPLGVDGEIFNPSLYKKSRNNKNYIFLSVGKWEHRKGHRELCKVFNDTFNVKDKVELWMMPHNVFLQPQEVMEWEKLYLNSRMGKANRITILPRVETQEEVSQIIAQSDCGIFLSRAEGFNLPALECLSMGKELILTGCSAHSTYCDRKNSHLITIDEMELAQDGKWFFGQGSWAKLGNKQLAQAGQYMRGCYENRKTNEEGIKTAKQFSWENTGKEILNALRKF